MLGGSPKLAEQPQNILLTVASWMWTSRPITLSHVHARASSVAGTAPSRTAAVASNPVSPSCGPMRWPPTGRPSLRPMGQTQCREARQADGRHEDVGQIHLHWVVGFLTGEEGHGWRRRREQIRNPLLAKQPVEVVGDERAHSLRLGVIGVVVSGTQNVGADDDAPFDLRSEPFAARGPIQRPHVDAVTPSAGHSERRRTAPRLADRFGRIDDVVRGDGVRRVRQGDVTHVRAEVAQNPDRAVARGPNPRVQVNGEAFPRQADR